MKWPLTDAHLREGNRSNIKKGLAIGYRRPVTADTGQLSRRPRRAKEKKRTCNNLQREYF